MSPLEFFDSRTRAWFDRRFEAPTDIQALAWPAIAAGEHVLATAPTGSGKTLTAFLWAIDRLASGAWEGGSVRVLYVSPLKALNNDIQRNLLLPLEELRDEFGDAMPRVTVQVRSGDTPQSERRRMLRHPPEILVTTPESLNLLLSSRGGRGILAGVHTLVLDEIHAVAGNKRGTYLMTAAERLVDLAGEVQRVALSATVRPLETIAAFAGGFDASGQARPVRTLRSGEDKKIAVRVCGSKLEDAPSIWPDLVRRFRAILNENRSTLFFVNNRALAERLVHWLNEDEEQPVAYAHHGSLSREIRTLVEGKLKRGELKALVATSSLELGIDVGDLDEVVLVQAPRTANSAIQRVGRAGHGVGETSRGRIFPAFPRDCLDAAVLQPLVVRRRGEALHPVRAPLDVLAQVIVAMCGVEEWDADALFAHLRRSHSYHGLRREAFDRVVAMLRGRYADTRLRELRPRLRTDPETGRLRGAAGALQLAYRSGGVIPDRGYFAARVLGSGAKLGELDEEFVWERRVGQEFMIGAQRWRIERITRSDVLVVPGRGGTPTTPPFWRAEAQGRDFELCEEIGAFLEDADGRLDDPALAEELHAQRGLDEEAVSSLLTFLKRQKSATGHALPHRHHVLVEHTTDPSAPGAPRQVFLHAIWGVRCLQPFGIALAAAWEREFGFAPEVFHDDDCLLVYAPEEFPTARVLDLVTAENVESLLRDRLEKTGFFGARFRENAMRALLLPRSGRQRMPLWLTRLRAQRLLSAIGGYRDFPIVAETWRTCLEDEFDLPRLRALLDELRTGAIRVGEVKTGTASPFTANVAWRGTNEHMYDRYERLRAGGARGFLRDEVLREALSTAELRPRIEPALVRDLETKLQRRAEGYEPRDDAEWFDLVEERLLVAPWTDDLPRGLELWHGLVASTAQVPRLERARGGDDRVLAQCLAQYLQSFGPVTVDRIADEWPVPRERLATTLERLVDEGTVIADLLTEGAAETEYCDAENLERLLRLKRATSRPSFEALPNTRLPSFLAAWQRVGAGGDDLPAALEPLLGCALPAARWEEAVLPARVTPYAPAAVDALLQESDLVWFGAGKEQAGFCFADDLGLFLPPLERPPDVFPSAIGRYDFFELQKSTGLESAELTHRLWELVWSGEAGNDTYAALRKGIETGFEASTPGKGRRNRAIRAWQSSRPLVGTWQARLREPAADRLEELEDDKERARALLARYGVLFRALCDRELPALRWGRVLRALRLMELAGEVSAGHFFEGVEGLQFASPAALRALRSGWKDRTFWLNACDPASLCGTGVVDLPPRVASTWLVYDGDRCVLVARRHGKEVTLHAEPTEEYLRLFDALLRRSFRPRRRVTVETIDGEVAVRHRHAGVFRAFGFVPDMDHLTLERRY